MVAAPQRAESPLLATALTYAARGWRVFPLAPNTKVPLIAKRFGGRGCLDATTSDGQIRDWWTKWPSANIGWAMGKGFVTIDEDTYKGADLSSWLLPPTLQSVSARGGLHHIYRYDGSLPCVPENELGMGICIKAEGGYIVAPPSRFQGKQYQFVDPHQPVVELPERLAELIRTHRALEAARPAERQRPPARTRQRDREDADAHWLAWALQKTGMGHGDHVGVLLAQQLLIAQRNGASVDLDGVLLDYARQATLDPHDPFTERDVERWKRSADGSKLVQRGEPARSLSAPTAVTERPHGGKTTHKSEQSEPIREQSVTDHADSVTDEPQESETFDEPTSPDEGSDDGDKALLRFSADDNGNAEAMRLIYGREFLYSPVYGWMHWAETHWQVVPEASVMRYVILALKRRRHAAVDAGMEAIVKATVCNHARVRGCLALFMAYVIEPSVDVFDANPDTLNCLNGVVNLRTGRVSPHQSRQRYTYCVPVPFDPRADMAAWEAFIHNAIGGNAEVARYLQVCAGYSLTGHTKDEKVFYLYGPTRAGKGTFTETLMALLPNPLSSEVDFATFTAPRDADNQNFDLAALKPARIVIASESNRRQKLNPARMKQFSGGNRIRCAFKHRDMFEYQPQFSVWLVSNHPVNADADDDALWGRLHVIEFPRSHLGQEDTTLKTRMKSAENLRGVLCWLVEGAQRWYQEKRLVAPAAIVDATRNQRDEQDYVRQWLEDRCELGAASWIASARLYASYQDWCKGNALTPMRPNELGETLVKRFNLRAKRQPKTGSRGYVGISLKSDGQVSLWDPETEG